MTRLTWRCALLSLACVLVTSLQQPENEEPLLEIQHNKIADESPGAARLARAISKEPGFFWTIGRLIYQQYNETKSAGNQITNLVNNGFTDTATAAPVVDMGPNATTTEAPYRVSRKEFLDILRRNLIGLRRLFDLEWRDAWNHSIYNVIDHQREVSNALRPYTIRKVTNYTTKV